MLQRLRSSIVKYGFVQNLVVRQIGEYYEVLSGNQRLKVIREFNLTKVPCVIVELDDGHARLLAQALNHVHGADDLGLRAELLREVLQVIPQQEVMAVLPDSMVGLNGMAVMHQETMAGYLQNWERARAAKLRISSLNLRQNSCKLSRLLSMVYCPKRGGSRAAVPMPEVRLCT